MIASRLIPERKCDGCRKQEIWGCTAVRIAYPGPGEQDVPDNWIRPAQMPVEFDGETTFACPRQHLKEHPRFWNDLLRYYAFYRKGFLPQQGGVVDQSNRAVELFRILDDVNYLCDQQETANNQRPPETPRGRQART